MKQVFFALILALFFSLPAFAQNQLCSKMPGTGGVVEAGKPMRFVATLSGKVENLALDYEWKVSAGTIMSGQGTCVIMVDTTGLAGGTNITAEVTVKGLPAGCPNTASETGSVVVREIISEPLDRFGKLPNDEIRARIDAMFVALGNEPNARAYLLSYGTEKEIAAREKLIKNHAGFRKYDAVRITLVRCGEDLSGEGLATTIWIVPPGAEPPTCR